MSEKLNSPQYPFDVGQELFTEPQEETTLERYALLALDMYARENQKRGFAIKLSTVLGDRIYEGWPKESEEVLELENRRYMLLKRADEYGRTAKMMFGYGYGIDTQETEITDLRRPNHSYVQAINPVYRPMLDKTYQVFYNNYGGLENSKLRDMVRHGKILVRIPEYSNIDLYYDKHLYRDDPHKPAEAPANLEEQVDHTDLIRSKKLLIDSLSVLGLRRGRLRHNGDFDDTQKNSPAFDRDTHNLTLRPRMEGQDLKRYCDRLSPDHMLQYVKLLYAEATELEFLYKAKNDPESIPFSSTDLDDMVKASWKEFWNVYNGWEEHTNNARFDYREELRLEIQTIRKAEKFKSKVLKKRQYRTGQIALH